MTAGTTTAGTATAPPAATGTLEDRLTDAMLRHALSKPRRIEYNPTPGPPPCDHRTPPTEPTTPHNADESDADHDPEFDDPPPF